MQTNIFSDFYKKKYISAFTLMELMVSLIIVSVLGVIAVSSFSTQVIDKKIKLQENQLSSAFQLAHTTAISIHRNVIMCPVFTSNVNNVTGCDDTATWSDGLIVMQNINGDGTLLPEQIDDYLFDFIPPIKTDGNTKNSLGRSFMGSGNFNPDSIGAIIFKYNGFVNPVNKYIAFCYDKKDGKENGFIMRYNKTGSLTITQDKCQK